MSALDSPPTPYQYHHLPALPPPMPAAPPPPRLTIHPSYSPPLPSWPLSAHPPPPITTPPAPTSRRQNGLEIERTPLRRPRRRVPPACAPRGVWGGVGGRARVRVTDGGKASRGRVAGNDGPATALSRHTETPESGGGGGRGTKRPRPRAHSVRARIQAAAGATGRRDCQLCFSIAAGQRRNGSVTTAGRPPPPVAARYSRACPLSLTSSTVVAGTVLAAKTGLATAGVGSDVATRSI